MNFYVCRSYRRKIGKGAFLPPPPIVNRAKGAKSFVEVVLPEAKIYVVYYTKKDFEAALTKTQVEILWESVLVVTGI